MRMSTAFIRAGFVSATLILAMPLSALAGDAGAFFGGMVAGKVIDNMTQPRSEPRSYSQPVQQAPAPAPTPAAQTPQQRLQQLDKLAAGGYITPEEYKRKRQAIINSM